MRPQKVNDEEVMLGLMRVLRAKGFDGASMNDLSEATGLKKASLYHRFPGGKKEIAEAVLKFVGEWSKENISGVLKNQEQAPDERLKLVITNINKLYNHGDSICILRALSMDSSLPLFNSQIENSFQVWLSAFTRLGEDFGFEEAKAKRLAMNVVVKIQGALILAKGIHDMSVFQQVLSDIEGTYQH